MVSSTCLILVVLPRLMGDFIAWTLASPSLEPTARENRHCSTLLPAPYNQLKARFLSMRASNSPNILSTLPINYRMKPPLLYISNGSSLRDSQRRISRCIFSLASCVFVPDTLLGMASTTRPFRSFRFPSDIAHPTSLRRSTQSVILVESYDNRRELIFCCLVLSSLNLQWSTLTFSFSVRRFLAGSKARIFLTLGLQMNPLITWTWHQLMLSLVPSKTSKAAWSSSRTTSALSLR